MSIDAIEETIKWRRRGLDRPWLPDSFMAELSPEALTQLERPGRVRRDIESIILTGDDAAVIIVLVGAVKVSRSNWDGKQTLIHIAGVGDAINAEALLTGNDVPRTTLSGERSAVLAIPRRRFGFLLAKNEEVRAALARQVAQRLQEHEIWRGHVGRTIEAQVWAFLVGLARRHGVLLDLGLTQADIASALGVSCSSVEGAMRNLRMAGKLRIGYAWVRLLELPSDEELDQSLCRQGR